MRSFKVKTDVFFRTTKEGAIEFCSFVLEDGNKAKVTIRFRGREMAHPEMAAKLLDRVVEETKELGFVEQAYHMEGRTMTMVLAPGKATPGT